MTLATALATALVAGLPPAVAETPEEARAAARAAAAELTAVEAEVATALRDYDRAMSGLAQGVARSIDAEREAALSDAALEAREDDAAAQVRAVYMSGGAPVLYTSLLDAADVRDLARRAHLVRRVMSAGTADVAAATRLSQARRARATALEDALDRRVVTARDVRARQASLEVALDRQQAALDRLTARASRLEAARAAALREARREARRRMRAARAAAAEATTAHVATARATDVPADYRRLYRGAATTCPGLSWTTLAAVGQVESGHGVDTGPSSAGAVGPMQFLPATFDTYGVDGDDDGDVDVDDPADAVYSAAHYLCTSGGGEGDDALWQALWHYNHADWYVEMVLRIAAQLEED